MLVIAQRPTHLPIWQIGMDKKGPVKSGEYKCILALLGSIFYAVKLAVSHVFAEGKRQHMSDLMRLTGWHDTRDQSGFDMEESSTVLLSEKALTYKKEKKQKDKMTGEALAKFSISSGSFG